MNNMQQASQKTCHCASHGYVAKISPNFKKSSHLQQLSKCFQAKLTKSTVAQQSLFAAGKFWQNCN